MIEISTITGMYLPGVPTTPSSRPMYCTCEPMRYIAGARTAMSCRLRLPAANRLEATPTPPPMDSQAASSTISASPGRPKTFITGPQTVPIRSRMPVSLRT